MPFTITRLVFFLVCDSSIDHRHCSKSFDSSIDHRHCSKSFSILSAMNEIR